MWRRSKKRFTMLSQKERFAWASKFQIYRGSPWSGWKGKARTVRRDNVNAGYYGMFQGFRLAFSVAPELEHGAI